MSVGAPVVAHRLAQNERLGGDTIHYAAEMTASALADALVDMLQDRTRAHRLGGAARERFVDQIAWESVGAPNLLQGYADTFGSERR
jgi:glycosyltransferase involved in cell wall biosynthesis